MPEKDLFCYSTGTLISPPLPMVCFVLVWWFLIRPVPLLSSFCDLLLLFIGERIVEELCRSSAASRTASHHSICIKLTWTFYFICCKRESPLVLDCLCLVPMSIYGKWTGLFASRSILTVRDGKIWYTVCPLFPVFLVRNHRLNQKIWKQ